MAVEGRKLGPKAAAAGSGETPALLGVWLQKRLGRGRRRAIGPRVGVRAGRLRSGCLRGQG